jgi:hypothetical protein
VIRSDSDLCTVANCTSSALYCAVLRLFACESGSSAVMRVGALTGRRQCTSKSLANIVRSKPRWRCQAERFKLVWEYCLWLILDRCDEHGWVSLGGPQAFPQFSLLTIYTHRNAKLTRIPPSARSCHSQYLHSTKVQLQLSLDGNFIRPDDVNTSS